MSDGSAAFAEIETTDVAPAAEPVSTPVVDTTTPVATPDTVAANEDSFGKEALGDETKSHDVYNDGGAEELSADQKATKNNKEWATPGDWNIGGNGGGPLNQPTAADKAEKKREEELDDFVEMIKEAHAQKERDAEFAKKWEEGTHTIGGHDFTGKRLLQMQERMQDPQFQNDFEEALMKKEGLTREEAKKRRLKVQELLDLEKKQAENGGRLTPEEERRRKQLGADPDVGGDLKKYVEPRLDAGIAYENKNLGIKNEDAYAAERKETLQYSLRDQKLADKAASKEPVYQKPDAATFSASENLISSDRLTPTYNTVAAGKAISVGIEPKVQIATAQTVTKLESTVQISGSGFG